MNTKLDKLTENKLEGNGIFDRLMQAVELHIQDEYVKSRITGSNYAQTYLGALQYVLQAAVQFATQGDLLDAQKALIEAQIDETKAKTKLTEKQIELVQKQIEAQEYEKELAKWKAVTEQANTQKVLEIGKNYVDPVENGTNIYGHIEAQDSLPKAQAWGIHRDAEQKLFKAAVVDIFNTVEAAEGVGANKFGLNGSNGISIYNKCRTELGIPELDTKIADYNSESHPYKDKWAPNATDISDSGTDDD